MNGKAKVLIGFLVFAIVIGGAYFAYDKLSGEYDNNMLATNAPAITNPFVPQTEQTTKETELYKAPDFTVYDSNGNAVKLSDYFGKPIVLNFWASWCPPCKMEMPDFNDIYKEKGNEYQFLMVNLTDNSRETVETAKAFIESTGYEFPVFYDKDIDAARKYNTYSIPVTYFIDKDGNMAAYAQGAIDKETLLKGMDMIK